jgi:hypothetical protein
LCFMYVTGETIYDENNDNNKKPKKLYMSPTHYDSTLNDNFL